MKKIAAMVLAGVLAAVPVSTTGAAEFQDGADTQKFIWAAGEETSTDTDESKGVSANDSVVEGLDKPLVFYPNTYYKFNVTGAGTQNTNPVEGDVRWTPISRRLQYKSIFSVSTIHSFLWELIKNYQVDIKTWIMESVQKEIEELKQKQTKTSRGKAGEKSGYVL